MRQTVWFGPLRATKDFRFDHKIEKCGDYKAIRPAVGVAQVPWKRPAQTEINYSDEFDSAAKKEAGSRKKIGNLTKVYEYLC